MAEWSKALDYKILVRKCGRSNPGSGECRLTKAENFIVKLLSTGLRKGKMISTLFLSF